MALLALNSFHLVAFAVMCYALGIAAFVSALTSALTMVMEAAVGKLVRASRRVCKHIQSLRHQSGCCLRVRGVED